MATYRVRWARRQGSIADRPGSCTRLRRIRANDLLLRVAYNSSATPMVPSLHQPANAGKARQQDTCRPDGCRCNIGDLKMPPRHCIDAGNERHHSAKWAKKTPDEHRDDSPSFEEFDATHNEIRACRHKPDLQYAVLEMQCQPECQQVADERTEGCGKLHRPEANISSRYKSADAKEDPGCRHK